MKSTPEGTERMKQLELAAPFPPPPALPVDPYLAYASWRGQGNQAPNDTRYAEFEARYAASIAPPPPPPAPEALPPWATASVDPLVARTAPAPVVLPAINPPEFQPPPSLEERAACLAPKTEAGVAPKEKKIRVRRANAELAAAKATERDFVLYVIEADGTLTTEVIVAAAVFVK